MSENEMTTAEQARMHKRDLINHLSSELGMTKKMADKVISETGRWMHDNLMAGHILDMKESLGGVYKPAHRGARRVRNPRTGDFMEVPEHMTINYQPYKPWKEDMKRHAA